jgi:hypothetical protein
MRSSLHVAFVAGLAAWITIQFPGIPVQAGILVSGLPGVLGTVKSSTEFVYQTGYPNGLVPVSYSATMVSPAGAKVQRGETVTVVGSFCCDGLLTATKVIIGYPYKIATMARDESYGQGQSASAKAVVQLVAYARGDNKAVSDCHSIAGGCKAVFYFDYNHPYNPSPGCSYQPDGQFVAAASESWFQHWPGYSDSAHRVYGEGPPGSFTCLIWQTNPNSSGAQNWWREYLRTNANNFDLYFLDDDASDVVDATYFPSGGGCSPWPSYCHATNEVPNDTAEEQARANFVNAMTHTNGSPMYFFSNGSILLDLAYTNRLIGESCEGCIANDARGIVPADYAAQLNQMASMNKAPGALVLISKGHWAAGSPEQLLQRLVTIGITWLAYDEGHTILMENLEDNTTRLAVWPEELIYPAFPLESMKTSANDLEVASGVYRREFATCSLAGIPFGRCAVVLNANAANVTIPSTWFVQSYTHAITLSGGDVLSGGRVNLAGGSFIPGLTEVAGGAAILLSP